MGDPSRPDKHGINHMDRLPTEIVQEVMVESGVVLPGGQGYPNRRWKNCLWEMDSQNRPTVVARTLLQSDTMSGDDASRPSCLERASRAGRADLLNAVLSISDPRYLKMLQNIIRLDNNRAMLAACRSGHPGCVKVMLQAPEYSIAGRQGEDALVKAAGSGHVKVVRLLLQSKDGPRADCLNGQALVAAVRGGRAKVAQLLLGWRHHAPRADLVDEYEESLLWQAVQHDDEYTVQALLNAPRHAARANEDSNVVRFAAVLDNPKIVRLLLNAPANAAEADADDSSALAHAAYQGDARVVEMLLNVGHHAAHANCLNSMGLVAAAHRGHLQVVKLLLRAKKHAARANCQESLALSMAAKKGHVLVVDLLLNQPVHAAKADCNDGEALIYAAMNGHAQVVDTLLEHGAHANCQGGLALVLAARDGHVDAAQRLLEDSHHPAHAASLGGLAFAIAEENGHVHVVETLFAALNLAGNPHNDEAQVAQFESARAAVEDLLAGAGLRTPCYGELAYIDQDGFV